MHRPACCLPACLPVRTDHRSTHYSQRTDGMHIVCDDGLRVTSRCLCVPLCRRRRFLDQHVMPDASAAHAEQLLESGDAIGAAEAATVGLEAIAARTKRHLVRACCAALVLLPATG